MQVSNQIMLWDPDVGMEHDSRLSSEDANSAVPPRVKEGLAPQAVTLDEVSHDRSLFWCSKPASSRTRASINSRSRLFGSATKQAALNAAEYSSLDRKAREADELKSKRDEELRQRAAARTLSQTNGPKVDESLRSKTHPPRRQKAELGSNRNAPSNTRQRGWARQPGHDTATSRSHPRQRPSQLSTQGRAPGPPRVSHRERAAPPRSRRQ